MHASAAPKDPVDNPILALFKLVKGRLGDLLF